MHLFGVGLSMLGVRCWEPGFVWVDMERGVGDWMLGFRLANL